MGGLIIIHYDFTDGTELSYMEAKASLLHAPTRTIHTCCLDFFSVDYNAVLVKKNGARMSVKSVMANTGEFTDKQIRVSYNLQKLLKAGTFNF